MEVDDESRYILDDTPDGGNIAFPILQSNTNLRPSDMQTPELLAMVFYESRDSLEYIFIMNVKIADEVHKDMVDISIAVLRADDL